MDRIVRIIVSFAFIFFQSTLVQAELIKSSKISFQNWSGGAYTDNTTGAFSHCVVSADYLSGDVLYFSLSREGKMGVGVESPNLNLSPGAQFPIALYVDRKKPIYGTAEAVDGNFATIFLPDLERTLSAFKRGRTLVIEGQGMRGEYDLTGTFRALDQVTKCAIDFYNFTQSPENSQNLSANVDISYLYQIATHTITSFGISDFEFDDAISISELGLGEKTVRWKANELGITGTIIAVNHIVGTDIRSTDAADIQFVASFCDDEIATTTRNLSDNGQQVREIRVLCAGRDQETEHYISKFLSGDLVFYTWFQFEKGARMPSENSAQSEASAAAISAASFVLD